MSSNDRQPSDAEALAALRNCAGRRGSLTVHPRCQPDMRRESFDVVAACELIAECDDSELWKSEPDYRPDRKDWIVVLRVKLEDGELYIKVALRRPGLDRGQFLAFKQWVD